MARERTSAPLESWLDTVRASALADLKRFAQGIHHDHAAMRAAIEVSYSNGQTAGHVTRLKLLKRQMYVRAKLDLLRQSVLHAA